MTKQNVKLRLILMNFFEFAVWGTWLISLGGYAAVKLGFTGVQIGSLFATMGLASLIMPGIIGIVADRWINAEKLLGMLHLLSAACLLVASACTSYEPFYLALLGASLTYMPTLALSNTVAFSAMPKAGLDIVKDFPPIRVFGTVGFILAMWSVDLLGFAMAKEQLYIAAGLGIVMGLYSFTLPQTPPASKDKTRVGKVGEGRPKGLASILGLDALVLLKNPTMLAFFLFAMLLGASLQITNTFGTPFFDSFKDSYAGSFAVEHPVVLLSLSQISETFFILAIPFFLGRYGIKKVMLMSMLAWFFRFGFFAIGNPGMPGFLFLILSMIVYGMAFDFFNVSGAMFVDRETKPEMRASAQGLFMIMTNGIGAIIGGYASGLVVDLFTSESGVRDWTAIWSTFAAYSLVIAILFVFLFRYKKDTEAGAAPSAIHH